MLFMETQDVLGSVPSMFIDIITQLADKGDHGGQKSGAIVRVTVSSLMSPHPWGDFPPQLSWSTSKRFIIIWGI